MRALVFLLDLVDNSDFPSVNNKGVHPSTPSG